MTPRFRVARPGASRLGLTLAWSAALAAPVAHAHHAMGGATPSTFAEGLLSGLAHPILGLDHFVFVLAIGLLAAVARLGVLLPVSYVLAIGVGLGLHLLALDVPGIELLIALSVLAIGWALQRDAPARARAAHRLVEGGVFAAAGVLHGYALAESIIGAERGVIGAYIIGLVAVQIVIAMSIYLAARGALASGERTAPAVRAAGLLIALSGGAFALGASGLFA